MIGTLCVPDPGQRVGTVGLLLLNAGIIHRIGPHRINVRLAREVATMGIPSLRFDLSGRGDSLPAAPGLRYDEQAARDVCHAVATLCSEGQCDRVILFGICSGADNGFAAAMLESRIASLVMFDPPIFPNLRWRVRIWMSKFRKYGLRAGFARLLAIRKTWVTESKTDSYGRDVPPVPEYVARLRSVADRGASIRLVYSGSTCDATDYEAQRRIILGAEPREAERIHTEFLPDIDHVVSTREAQELLLSRMRAWISEFKGA